jgi:hypothetical protein
VFAAVVLSAVDVVGNSTPAAATSATGLIAGSVDDIASGVPVPGVCVYAYAVNGEQGSWVATGASYRAVTESDGSYEVAVPVANYAVEFDPSCEGTVPSPYARQYYLAQVDLEDANTVFASAISPATATEAEAGLDVLPRFVPAQTTAPATQ